MIRLTTILEMLGMNTLVHIIGEGENETRQYAGKCANCTMSIWARAYVVGMMYDENMERYNIMVIYKQEV